MAQFVETTEPDVARQIIAEQYSSVRFHAKSGQNFLRLGTTSVGRAHLDRVNFGMSIHGGAEPLPMFCLVRSRRGSYRFQHGDTDERYGPGEAFLPVPPGPGWTVTLIDTDSDVLALPRDLVDEVAGVSLDESSHVQLISNRPHSALLGAQLWRLFDTLSEQSARDPAAWSTPLVADSAARLLAAVALTAFPSTAITEPTIEDRHDAHTPTLRRAVAFIEARPDQPVSLLDIAVAANVTPRAVQLAFRRHLGTTPMAYLRRVRLGRAHDDLRSADPARSTVTAIAMRWGFTNPGRFAAYYARAYGHRPGTILHSTG